MEDSLTLIERNCEHLMKCGWCDLRNIMCPTLNGVTINYPFYPYQNEPVSVYAAPGIDWTGTTPTKDFKITCTKSEK